MGSHCGRKSLVAESAAAVYACAYFIGSIVLGFPTSHFRQLLSCDCRAGYRASLLTWITPCQYCYRDLYCHNSTDDANVYANADTAPTRNTVSHGDQAGDNNCYIDANPNPFCSRHNPNCDSNICANRGRNLTNANSINVNCNANSNGDADDNTDT